MDVDSLVENGTLHDEEPCQLDHTQETGPYCSGCEVCLQSEPYNGKSYKVGQKVYFLTLRTDVVQAGTVVEIPFGQHVKVRYDERTWASAAYDETMTDLSRVGETALQLIESMGTRSRRKTNTYVPPVKVVNDDKKRKRVEKAKIEKKKKLTENKVKKVAAKPKTVAKREKKNGLTSRESTSSSFVEPKPVFKLSMRKTCMNYSTFTPPSSDSDSDECDGDSVYSA
jgi:hypothetical protein